MAILRLFVMASLAALACAVPAAAQAAVPGAPAALAPAAVPAAPAAPAPAGPAAPAPSAESSAGSLAGSPAAAQPSPEERILQVADRLTDEAERQHEVNQRMDVVIDRFLAIVADLQSNDLIRQGNGPALQRLAQVLKMLSTSHVPEAARYLEEARRQLAALKPNLAGADKEIAIIIAELDKILTGNKGVSEDLLRELEVIIQDEKRNHQETKDWGALALTKPEAADRPGREAASNQDRIAKRAERFMGRLAEARDAEKDPARRLGMQKASDVLDQNKVPKLLGGAARDIEDKKPVAATKAQEDAIRFLEEAAKFLRQDNLADDIQAMKELREKLEGILKDQTELREKTEKVPAQEFPQKKNELQAQQRGLDKQVQDVSKDLPQTVSPPVKNNIQAADKDMQKADHEIASAQQQPAAESQKEAEKDLASAIKALDQDVASAEREWQQQNQPSQSLASLAQQAMDLAKKQLDLKQETGQTQPQALPQLAQPQNGLQQEAQALSQQLPMPQFKQAAQAMQQASQSLQQSQQQQAEQQQQKAADSLMSAAQALQQAQAAMALAAQQQALMAQTGQTPSGALPQLSAPQQGLQREAQAADFQQAAQAMQQASQSLQQSQQQPAMQSQQAAIDSLMGQAMAAMGMQPGQGTQPSAAPGMMPGQMPGPAMPNVPTVDPMVVGSREFGRGGAEGPQAGRGEDHWRILGDRERDTLYQKYARQLPPEYRELLGDYFEALSKESPRATRTAAPAGAPAGGNP